MPPKVAHLRLVSPSPETALERFWRARRALNLTFLSWVKERSEAAAIELVMASRRMRRARSRSRAFLATPLGSALSVALIAGVPSSRAASWRKALVVPLVRHGRAHPTVSRAIFISPDGKLEYTSADIQRRGGAA